MTEFWHRKSKLMKKTLEDEIFKSYNVDYSELLKYGFIENDKLYIFEKLFFHNKFKAVIKITGQGSVSGKVYDNESGEEYLPLRLNTVNGAFVSEVREEYKRVLKDICDKCFTKKAFIYSQSCRIADFIYKKYSDTPRYLWEKFPTYGVFRDSSNNKWYGIIVNIDYSKIDKNKKGEIEILNVKLDQNKINELLKTHGYYPAWHMNKKTWISIVLDNNISDEIIMELIEESRSAVLKQI